MTLWKIAGQRSDVLVTDDMHEEPILSCQRPAVLEVIVDMLKFTERVAAACEHATLPWAAKQAES